MKLINNALNFLYPNVCGICKRICDKPICNNCKNRINKKVINNRKVYISTKKRHFDEHMYIFKYTDIIRNLIVEYKFKESSYLYKTFSYMILENKKVIDYIKKYDYIICVPIHKKRKENRGYNQSELIINEVCKINNEFNLVKDILIKKENTKAQSSLNKIDRVINIQNAYEIDLSKKDIINNRKILIFDDIYTTGSTVNECARMLKKYGTKDIGILTIAKA